MNNLCFRIYQRFSSKLCLNLLKVLVIHTSNVTAHFYDLNLNRYKNERKSIESETKLWKVLYILKEHIMLDYINETYFISQRINDIVLTVGLVRLDAS